MDEDCHFEELAHTADVGARVRAATPAALFACAARSLFALIGARPGSAGSWQPMTVAATAMPTPRLRTSAAAASFAAARITRSEPAAARQGGV
ncbi:MAG: archease [Chloroflexales bacterium]|nr:archease [Chloroflexales bacterium]